MMKPIFLSVFFPVYNERENLPLTIRRTIETLDASPFIAGYEIIVVDDGSRDGSGKLAEALARKHPSVRVIHHPKNLGYGEALKTGIGAARMEYVFFTDADLQFDILELNALVVHLSDYPVVIGYRAPRRDPWMRLLNAWGWNLLNRLLFGLRVRDIDCAFKVFKRELVQKLDLQSHGAMISAETLIRLADKEVPVKEIPVSHLPRKRGSPTGAKLSVIYRAFQEMIELYRGELGEIASRRAQGEALRFITVGVINTALDASLYFSLTRFIPAFSEHLLIAKFLSFLAGTVSSFVLNRSWTFAVSKRVTVAEVARFYAMVSLSLFVNLSLMNLFISIGVYDLAALAVTTVCTFVVNFLISKFWVFRHAERPRYA